MGTREKNIFFLLNKKGLFVHAAVRGEICVFTLKIVNTLFKNSSRDDRPSISTLKQPTANPVRVGQGRLKKTASKMSGGSVVYGARSCPRRPSLFTQTCKKAYIFAIGEESIIFVACFLHSSAQMCLYLTSGPRPPPITGGFVNTVTRLWVGACLLYTSPSPRD